jgi:transcriptional regulator with XRE-family HTH domain/tetratricopeptide (TPR) repeat protein
MNMSQTDLLKTARQRLHWSQRDLAQRLGVTPGYIALLEGAERSPSQDLWNRITRVFRADPRSQDLFPGDVAGPAQSFGHVTFTGSLLGYAPPPEFPIEFSLDPSWLAHVPFTVVTGAAGSGKTTLLRLWGEKVEMTGVRRVFWASLNTFSNDLGRLPTELLHFFDEDAESFAQSLDLSFDTSPDKLKQAAQIVANRIEEHPRSTAVLCFDEWQPHGDSSHEFVQYLAASLKKTPVIAATNTQRPVVPGAVIVPVPELRDENWANWCKKWQVPNQLASDLLTRIHRNILAAVYLKGAVFFAVSTDSQRATETLWKEIIPQLPEQADVPWESILRICLDLLGSQAMQMIREVAESSAPIPATWLAQDLATGIMSRLTHYKFLASITGRPEPLVSVHEVLRHFVKQLGTTALSPRIEARTTALSNGLVEMLLKSGRYEEAAQSMEQLAKEWSRRTEAPSLFIEWMLRLPDTVRQNHPVLIMILARAHALRAHPTDVNRARTILESLLKRRDLGDGVRLQAIRHVADVAIRQHDYAGAEEWVGQAQRITRSAPGSFHENPLQILAARIAWEQGQFPETLSALASPALQNGADGARFASWEGRAHASLGNFAAAAKAVQRGLEIARRENIRRAEAYNAVLLAEYELLRGNFARAQRLAERTFELAKNIGQPNLEAQALMVEAELAATGLQIAEAQKLLFLAQDALTQRADDSWSHCYLLVSQARVAQMQPDSRYLYSLAQQIEYEAAIVQSRSPRHPVVGAMRVEAAWCWATANYMHQAQRVLDTVNLGQCEWRTRWDAKRLELVTGRLSQSAFEQTTQQLIQNAQEAGCPYLAAVCGYTAASYGWLQGFHDLATRYAQWTLQVAKARGWTILALIAQGISPSGTEHQTVTRGQVVIHEDGTRTVVAPRRGQQRAREDTGLPLTDPYEE